MPKIFVFSGPSGVGKSTIIKKILEIFPEKFEFSISTTTRPRKKGEQHGREYYFVTREEFERMIKENQLVEYQEIYGNYYGTTKKEIERILNSGKNVIMDIDVYGKVNFDKVYPDNIGIFIEPPSIEELKNRLIKRGRDTIEEIEKRLEISKKEIEFAKTKKHYKYFIVNQDLNGTIEKVKKIIEENLED